MDTEDIRAENESKWTATQVGLRLVESCLGGHEEGVIGEDEGVENTSLPLWKQGRTVLSECAAFSGFIVTENNSVGEG